MKRTVWIWELFGFAVTSLFGTLLHFLYEWLGEAWWIAPFSGVNESTWEHMKLLYFPMLLFTLVQSFFFRSYRAFPCVKLKSTLLGLALIPVIFYTYNGVIGKSPDWVNIAIFFISAAVAYIYETRALSDNSTACRRPTLAWTILIFIAVLFIFFTFKTPHIAIYKDPLSGKYGT